MLSLKRCVEGSPAAVPRGTVNCASRGLASSPWVCMLARKSTPGAVRGGGCLRCPARLLRHSKAGSGQKARDSGPSRWRRRGGLRF